MFLYNKYLTINLKQNQLYPYRIYKGVFHLSHAAVVYSRTTVRLTIAIVVAGRAVREGIQAVEGSKIVVFVNLFYNDTGWLITKIRPGGSDVIGNPHGVPGRKAI